MNIFKPPLVAGNDRCCWSRGAGCGGLRSSPCEVNRVSTCFKRASSSFTYPLFGPLFFRTSSYSQGCPKRAHVEHFGFLLSHFSFRFRQVPHASTLLGSEAFLGSALLGEEVLGAAGCADVWTSAILVEPVPSMFRPTTDGEKTKLMSPSTRVGTIYVSFPLLLGCTAPGTSIMVRTCDGRCR